jgi:mannose-1-phosphate guanylyltransferase/mannose-6-phosphate isomerase
MAGGSGTRLWPASTSKLPKQFLSIAGRGSFFSAALERALGVIDSKGDGRVIIIAGKSHVPHIIEACRLCRSEDINRLVLIPEPEAKNTAPAIACGTLYTDWVSGRDRNILVLTSDHIIEPLDIFKANAAAAAAFAQQDRLVVFGITPKAPETGYGYIEAAEALTIPHQRVSLKRYDKPAEPAVFKVASFREKPDEATAKQFLKTGHFYWNSGMFAFSSRFLIGEFKHHAPELITPFEKLVAPNEQACTVERGLRVLGNWTGLDEAYRTVKGVSFDYAIAEKCARTIMVAAGFDWFDVGSWDEYAKLTEGSASGVYRSGSENCFVDADVPVALCGVNDLIVVVRSGKDGSPQAVLISKKGETQRVKAIVEQIRAAGKKDLL